MSNVVMKNVDIPKLAELVRNSVSEEEGGGLLEGRSSEANVPKESASAPTTVSWLVSVLFLP